uniref:U2AF homology motif kinase 1 n=1 Tax=Eptatretus burgeri TaxID=7764 RepID=A0A8C4N2M0_EPTBU
MSSTALRTLPTVPFPKDPLVEEVVGGAWRFEAPLGRGASAAVFRVGRGTARAALKRVSCGDGEARALHAFLRERHVLEHVRGHRNVVQLYGVFMSPGPLSGRPGTTSPPCLLLELLDISVSELLLRWEHLRGSSLWVLQHCARDVLCALTFLHARGYVHADLKPRNILWSAKDECFKVIDFGLSFKHGEQVRLLTRETNKQKKPPHCCGCQVDLWSLGIILLEMYWAMRLKDLGPSPDWGVRYALLLDEHIDDLADIEKFLLSLAAPNVEDLLFLPTRVLRLLNLVVDAHMLLDDEYQDVLEDVREECKKFGEVRSVLLPKEESNKGQVFVEFSDAVECQAAQQGLSARSFDGKLVVATFFPSDAFRHGCLYQPLS